MNQNSNSAIEDTAPVAVLEGLTAHDALTEILQPAAQKMLMAAIDREVSEYIDDRIDLVD